MKITFCIPSKNNLRYLKTSINSIRENSSTEHNIVVFLDADNDGTEEWLIQNKITYLKNETGIPKGIAFGYNRCIEAAETEIVCTFHADMYMAKGFDTAILKHVAPGKVVCGTRIEPPLHPKGKEKIIENFGMYPEDFKKEEFDSYVEKMVLTNRDVTTRGIFAPWAAYKEDVVKIELHDEYFHSYHEDSDIFNRFILNGYEMIQTWEGYVYHLTCRGGQFQDGVEQVTADPSFHDMKGRAFKHYLRKWGSLMLNDEYQYPILIPKYDIGFRVSNCRIEALQGLELWCSSISSDTSYAKWLEEEQQGAKFNLLKRVKPWNAPMENDIIVEFDASRLTQQSFYIIQQLPQIIAESGEIGEFELDIFRIKIRALNTHETKLILNSDPYYTDQLL